MLAGFAPQFVPRAESLVARFDFPRQSAAAQAAGRDSVVALLERAGLAPRVTAFTAVPGRLDLTAALALAGLLVCWRAHRRRHSIAVAVLATAALGALAGALDPLLPGRPAYNVDVGVEPRGAAVQEVWLAAHYDSKTEGWDHRARARACGVTATLAGLALLLARHRPRAARVCGCAGFALAAATAGAGHFARRPSHGIVDNAQSVALVIEWAAQLRSEPLAHTRVRCVFLGAEEQGAQGSAAFVRAAPARPQAAVNLEGVGAGPGLGIPRWEWTGRGWAGPATALRQRLRTADPSIADVGLPLVTDCGPWLAAGIPALTLLGLEAGGAPPHGLHTAQDRQGRVDAAGVQAARAAIGAWLRAADPAGPAAQ